MWSFILAVFAFRQSPSPSVVLIRAYKSKIGDHMKFKFGVQFQHDIRNRYFKYFKVKRLEVKVTRPH